jgi:acyl carrier protein
MEKYISWLKQWFINQSNLSDFPDNSENRNYFEMGLIDSFNVIELIESIETEFQIKFDQNHFQDRRFSTIKGLAEIMNEIKQEKS